MSGFRDYSYQKEIFFKNASYRYFKTNKQWEYLIDLWDKQGRKCAITGKPIRPSKSMHLDHILPISKYPQLAGQLSNVQWTHRTGNWLKHNLTPEELFDICKYIVDNYQPQKADDILKEYREKELGLSAAQIEAIERVRGGKEALPHISLPSTPEPDREDL
jgi:hypothetical protein